MKKEPLISDHCENAAKRVKYLFSGGKQPLVYSLFLEERASPHSYSPLKAPRKPAALSYKIGYPSKKKSTQSQKQTHVVTEGWNTASKNTHQFGLSQAHADGPKGTDLRAARVRLWKLKEHFLASRKLKGLTEQKKESSTKREIKLLAESDPQKQEDQKNQEYWEAFIKNKEERQFQIGRVIKYLSK